MRRLTLLQIPDALMETHDVSRGLNECQSGQAPVLLLTCYGVLACVYQLPEQTQVCDGGFLSTNERMKGEQLLKRTVSSTGITTESCLRNSSRHSVPPATSIPLPGETVIKDIDGESAGGKWLVRDQKQLLEFYRELPAINGSVTGFGRRGHCCCRIQRPCYLSAVGERSNDIHVSLESAHAFNALL